MMIEWTFFYRLLGIPEQVAEPTVYQLLGFTDPRAITRESIQEALNERKKLLRQNIPGPQFIPIVSAFEQELDRAAAIILDPHKRKAYHQRLFGEIRARKKLRKTRAARQALVQAAREVIRTALAGDGTLEAGQRPALAER